MNWKSRHFIFCEPDHQIITHSSSHFLPSERENPFNSGRVFSSSVQDDGLESEEHAASLLDSLCCLEFGMITFI